MHKKEIKLTWISCVSCEDCATQVLSNKKHIVEENDYYDLLSKLKDPTFKAEDKDEDMNRFDDEDEYEYSYDDEDEDSFEEDYWIR